jgi:hypothetical protein
MPLSLGDANKSFLSPTKTQYFFLEQWSYQNTSLKPPAPLGAGEFLDRAVLVNCLGGRFSPGIEMTFICRQKNLYIEDWQTTPGGPFRINAKTLDYNNAVPNKAFLTGGWFPLRTPNPAVEPGDISKFMSIPWHTDYNSCATHTTDPEIPGNNTLYWSWPAERPVAVYAAHDVQYDAEGNPALGSQRFSVRGPGAESAKPECYGRYQNRCEILTNWEKIGTVIQATAISGAGEGTQPEYRAEWFLEVESKLGYGAQERFPTYADNNKTNCGKKPEEKPWGDCS